MKLKKILDWFDGLLKVGDFDDVSNNGLQVAREGDDIGKVAFAVDGSLKSVKAAASAGAQLLVVHHGISWGGGIRRLVGGEYAVVKAAMDSNIALAGYHLPLDANRKVGNNWEIARHLKLAKVKPAFPYHGNVIGLVGRASRSGRFMIGDAAIALERGEKVGVCSGGAGEFAVEAKSLGCDVYVTGEANWGEQIAAENVGMTMVCASHYATETFGVKALSRALAHALGVKTVFVGG